ncbi:MAG TPA: DNA primase [Clostridiaceae bacterium]|nr:DNA primase [Clostridia bacterium]HJJ09420.1 DNA primase [Clostridiaceae bacterium]
MVRYSEELIEEIKNSNDIVDVISQYVNLKRSGRNFFGLCPFHKEKSPSFSVSPDKQIFHCFGCGAGGNVIHFISKIENADFKEAIGILANRAGIELPTLNNYEDNKTALLKSKVYEINQIAAEFYHQNLYKPTSKIGQEYIKKRKLDNRTLKSFLIGYSGNFDELYRILKQKGFTEEEILASSLVNKTDDGKYIDRFRKRVMFPIQDTRNKVIAFGGRVTDDSKPKYINSPENIVYSKGRHLFGLNVAKRGELKNIIIVEGYMDAISLYQRGITNVVASLGTALTEAQGRLLRRYSERVTIGYDSDGAGQAATLRGLEILQNIGCDVRILQISGAKDPDEYVIKYGPERFLKCVEQAISLVEFKVKMLKQSLNLDNINDKIKFLNQVAKILSNVTNSIERELYVEKIANEYNVSKEAIYGEVNKLIYAKNTGEKTLEKPIVKKEIKKEKQEIDSSTTKRENLIIYLLINYPQESYKKIKSVISENDMKLEENQKILKKMYEEIEKGNINIDILNYFEEQNIIDHISGIMSYDFEISDLNKCIEDVVNTYEKDKLINRRQEILDIIKNGQGFSEEELNNLEDELSNIVIKLKK